MITLGSSLVMKSPVSHLSVTLSGIDVIHPAPNSPISDVSIAAIVGSFDEDAAKYHLFACSRMMFSGFEMRISPRNGVFRYSCKIKVQGRCNETVQRFENHFVDLFWKYRKVSSSSAFQKVQYLALFRSAESSLTAWLSYETASPIARWCRWRVRSWRYGASSGFLVSKFHHDKILPKILLILSNRFSLPEVFSNSNV